MHPLPNYARRIEYLESTGTQWIDTGVAASGVLRVVADAQYLDLRSTPGLFGVVTSLRFDLVVNGNNFKWEPGYHNTYTSSTVAADSSRHTFDLSNRFVLDGISLWVRDVAEFSAENVLIFALQRIGRIGNFAKARLYSLQFLLSGVPVRSFVPCRVGSVGYLWDEVTGAFFGNSGTGNFVLGTDIAGGGYHGLPTPLHPLGGGLRE